MKYELAAMSGIRKKPFVFRLNDHGQGPELLRHVFLERGWQEYDEEEQAEHDWNLWWRSSRFRHSDYELLRPWQRLNHFPKCTAITKKDALARNLRRMKAVHGAAAYSFSPLAFNLPNDYTKFLAHCSKLKEKGRPPPFWICKPADLSRGRGIFIFRELSELQYDCNAVVQQYVSNPLLISGYKFDLRIYVLVPSFQPLTIYIYNEGLVRFGTEKFDLGDISNTFAHLTNTSINKHSPNYITDKERVGPGCKWTLAQLRSYLRQASVDDQTLFLRIISIVILTILVQADAAPTTRHCFELFGFDIIVDEHLKPWLLEVNFSPSLSSDCQVDLLVKKPLLHDLLDLLHLTDADRQRGQRPHPIGCCSDGRSLRRHRHRRRGSGGSAEEEDAEVGSVAAIVPGCGLPSVQQPPPPRPPASPSSGRSTASSCEDEGSILGHRRAGRRPPGAGHRGLSFGGSGNRPNPCKLRHLRSLHSDSAFSSNSSDNCEERPSPARPNPRRSHPKPASVCSEGSEADTRPPLRERPMGHSAPSSKASRPILPRPRLLPQLPRRMSEAYPSRAGDYFMAFPFNAVTRKSAEGKLDARTVIQECQKVLRGRAKAEGSAAHLPSFESPILWPSFGDYT